MGENIVACPNCGDPIDAVAVICDSNACPECDTPARSTEVEDLFDMASDDDRSPGEVIDQNHAPEVDA
jgi:endogenous inhibitor of DNA gyrase (YacG/DUF329 family)